MDNFFVNNKDESNQAFSIENQQNQIKNHYENIFEEALIEIKKEINKFRPENPCKSCNIKNCNISDKNTTANYPSACPYRDWQIKFLSFLTVEYKEQLKKDYNQIMSKKDNYNCTRCGACCKLAVSEFSYAQLKQKALRGDKFATMFTSVFVPYESENKAREANKEYFDNLNSLIEDKVYYYYCPKVKNNECSDYENRPDICKDFPHNPLKILPPSCYFNNWKEEVSHDARRLKAKVDIIDFYKHKLG